LCFTIKSLGYFGWAADVTQRQNVHLKFTALVCDLETVAHLKIARRLHWLAIGLDPAQFTSSRGKGAGFEEARCP
jgi:hypothetical protein